MPDLNRVDLLIQYALLVAGESDESAERELGPIHLIKYVYLGDLAHARRFSGQSFTGVQWQFFKFGPWAAVVNERVQPALQAMGANVRTIPSRFEGKEDWSRWSMSDKYLLESRERTVPAAITLRLRPEIRRFGGDTAALLDHVYRTGPMLNAAPGEHLDLSSEAAGSLTVGPIKTYDHALSAPLRVSEDWAEGARLYDPDHAQKQAARTLKEKIAALRNQNRATPRSLTNPVKSPRYDDVYRRGVAWLDSLAGEQVEPGEYVAQFDDSVWKSPTRKIDDVP